MAAVVFEAHAADQGVKLQYMPPVDALEVPVVAPTTLWDRYKTAFDENADEQFADDFRPFNALNWNLKLADRDSQQVRDRIPDAARHALAKSAVNGLREIALELPFMVWLKEHQSFLADFLLNSIGNVHEEALSPLDLSYGAAERNWWQTLSENRTVNYGIRPFRTSPYAFLSTAFRDGDRAFLLANARYYYRSFTDHRFELSLSVPLAEGFSFDVGTSYEFGHQTDQTGLVLKLIKALKGGGTLHVGFEAKRNPLMFAGIALPF